MGELLSTQSSVFNKKVEIKKKSEGFPKRFWKQNSKFFNAFLIRLLFFLFIYIERRVPFRALNSF